MRVETGFTADVAYNLRPRQFAELRRNAGFIDKRMAYVDIKLKGNGKALIQQLRGDKDALRIAGFNVAVTDGAFYERAVKVLGHQGFVAVTDGERDKIISLAVQRRGNGAGHGVDDAFQIAGRQCDFACGGVTDSVGCLGDPRFANNLLRVGGLRIDGLTH